MKINSYNIIQNKQDLYNMLTDIQDLLNYGLYQSTVSTSIPTVAAQEGEFQVAYSGTDVRLYYYINGGWKFVSMNNRIEAAGWNYITETANQSIIQAQPFGVTFPSAPLVFVSYIGSRLISDGVPTGPDWFTGALTLRACIGYAVTTSQFTVGLQDTAGGNLSTTYYSGYTWRALSQ